MIDLDALNAGNPLWFSAREIRKVFAAAPPDVPWAM
jgi:hypothetical protein